jgi:hypothetical protein
MQMVQIRVEEKYFTVSSHLMLKVIYSLLSLSVEKLK